MGTRRGLLAGVVAVLLAGPGCVCCDCNGYGLARDAGPTCDVPTCQRDQVYVFAVGGMNPFTATDLGELRGKLNRRGFAKVATGQTAYAWWMAGEVRRIHEEKPNAVFVFVGTDGGTATAVRLAERAVGDGVPVGGVVLIDPEGKAAPPQSGLRTLTLASPDAEPIAELLNELAAATPGRAKEEPSGWHYPHAPLPRPTLDPARTPDWAYLFDQPGGATRPINESVPVNVPQPNPPSKETTARR